MPKILWDQSFSVGNADLDDQHKKWIDIINRLHDNLMHPTFQPESGIQALEEMLVYALTHFAAEERYMKKIGFSGAAAHASIHVAFQKKVENIISSLRSGQFILDREIMALLMEWLSRHILDTDKKYAVFQQGATA